MFGRATITLGIGPHSSLDFLKHDFLRSFEMSYQKVVEVFSKRNKTSGFVVNISKQQVFETKMWLDYDANIIT